LGDLVAGVDELLGEFGAIGEGVADSRSSAGHPEILLVCDTVKD